MNTREAFLHLINSGLLPEGTQWTYRHRLKKRDYTIGQMADKLINNGYNIVDVKPINQLIWVKPVSQI